MSYKYESVVHGDGIARRVVLESVANFRDLGGFLISEEETIETKTQTTNFGKLFRSDQLGLLTDNDIKTIVEDLGIKQVVDLRGKDELEVAGKGPLADHPDIEYFHLPVSEIALARYKKSGNQKDRNHKNDPDPKNTTVGFRYFRRLMIEAPSFKTILTHLAENPKPTIFNCVAGRDRTGLIAMLALGAAGVSYSSIADDYAGTARVPEEERTRLQDPRLIKFWEDYIQATGTTYLKTQEEMTGAMFELLGLLDDDFGSGEKDSGLLGYLNYLDVPIDKLKALLTS